MKKSKRCLENGKLIDSEKAYKLQESIEILKKATATKFDESVDVVTKLGINPRKADQIVRGTVVLPNGTGKKVRILVFAKDEKQKDAEDAGADIIGTKEHIKKIQEGWIDFDVVIATPDMMRDIGRLGKVLGPRGLMPNPKSGTVTNDIKTAIKEIKAGKVSYRVDKYGNVHSPIGKVSFSEDKLTENANAFIYAILRDKPISAKGIYFRGISISSTMGPGIKLDVASTIQSLYL